MVEEKNWRCDGETKEEREDKEDELVRNQRRQGGKLFNLIDQFLWCGTHLSLLLYLPDYR